MRAVHFELDVLHINSYYGKERRSPHTPRTFHTLQLHPPLNTVNKVALYERERKKKHTIVLYSKVMSSSLKEYECIFVLRSCCVQGLKIENSFSLNTINQ